MLKVRLYRPFSIDGLRRRAAGDRRARSPCSTAPRSRARSASRSTSTSSTALARGAPSGGCASQREPRVIGGRYGLSSKEFTPAMVEGGLRRARPKPAPKNHFTVGIVDDVTHLSLAVRPRASTIEPDDVVRAVFFGLGSDGTVGANKNSIKIIGEETDNLRPGLLRLRLEEGGRDDHLAPALRPAADPLAVPDPARELRRLPPVPVPRRATTCSTTPRPARRSCSTRP